MLYEQIMNEFRPKLLLLVQENHQRVIDDSFKKLELTSPCKNTESIQAQLLADPIASAWYQQLSSTECQKLDSALPIVIKIEIINCYLQQITEDWLDERLTEYNRYLKLLSVDITTTPKTKTTLASVKETIQFICQMLTLRSQYRKQLPDLQHSLTTLVPIPHMPFFEHSHLLTDSSALTSTPHTPPLAL